MKVMIDTDNKNEALKINANNTNFLNDIEYAYNHNYNILYEDLNSSCIEIVFRKIDNYKYNVKIIRDKDYAPDGTKLPDKISLLFIHPVNKNK